MTDRILDFSENPARLNVRLRQLVVQRREMPDVSMPLAELAITLPPKTGCGNVASNGGGRSS
ncbi:MAG TPA: hypothetical protein VMY42_17055 [Thermoguttaceae bacterium]|nr:hypothetical protein [Thermoguttaceae bacterium]